MANTYKNIVITPNIGSNTTDPKVVYSGGNTTANTDITLYVYPNSNGSLSWEGSAGQLFSITNDLSNNLFGVNDVSGLPYMEIYANGFITFTPANGSVSIASNTTVGNATFGNTFLNSYTGISNPNTFSAGVLQTNASLNTLLVGPYTISSGNSLIVTSGSRVVII